MGLTLCILQSYSSFDLRATILPTPRVPILSIARVLYCPPPSPEATLMRPHCHAGSYWRQGSRTTRVAATSQIPRTAELRIIERYRVWCGISFCVVLLGLVCFLSFLSSLVILNIFARLWKIGPQNWKKKKEKERKKKRDYQRTGIMPEGTR